MSFLNTIRNAVNIAVARVRGQNPDATSLGSALRSIGVQWARGANLTTLFNVIYGEPSSTEWTATRYWNRLFGKQSGPVETIANVEAPSGAVTQATLLNWAGSALQRLYGQTVGRMMSVLATGIRSFIAKHFSGKQPPSPTGVPLTPQTTDRVLEQFIDSQKRRMKGLAQDYINGKIDVVEFRNRMSNEIRTLHLGAAILGAGGMQNLSPYHLRMIEQRVAEQEVYLDNLISDFQRKLPLRGLTARDVERVGSYANAARVTYQQSMRQFIMNESQGEGFERRVLGSAEHCPDCVEYAQMGWQPVGTLPPIGDSQCGQNCKCSFEFNYDDRSEPDQNDPTRYRSAPEAEETVGTSGYQSDVVEINAGNQ